MRLQTKCDSFLFILFLTVIAIAVTFNLVEPLANATSLCERDLANPASPIEDPLVCPHSKIAKIVWVNYWRHESVNMVPK